MLTFNMNLLWLKVTDLRLIDNPALKYSLEDDKTIIIFCLSPELFSKSNIIKIKKFGIFKEKFLYESIIDLNNNISNKKGKINIFFEKEDIVIPRLVNEHKISKIYHNLDTTSEEVNLVKLIKKKVKAINTNVTYNEFWANTMYYPNELPYKINNLPNMFTHFRKKIEQYHPKEVDTLDDKFFTNCISINNNINQILQKYDKLKDILTPFIGGESNAWKRLKYYFYQSKLLSNYKNTRNGLIGKDYSSKFSPYLAFGNISGKSIYFEILNYENLIESNKSTYWMYFELLWRDYFRFYSLKFGNDIFKLTGPKNFKKKWNYDVNLFNKWINGETGYPFIDANMKELKKTGFMSNRGRQVVASFLIKDLKIDWRWGAMYFESMLVDYDVASNYGNWTYSAGVGADPREDRYFNVYKQASRYDKDCQYILNWIPELKKFSKKDIINCLNLTDYHKKIVKIKNNKIYR